MTTIPSEPQKEEGIGTAVKERPILFSAPMVRALLDGSKTQTRRVVKGIALDWLRPEGFTPEFVASPDNHLSPYGFPGDRLWVRETFQVESTQDYEGDPGIAPPLGPQVWVDDEGYRLIPRYRASEPDTQLMIAPTEKDDIGMRWRPSIFMPRWASRITLDITGVRVERLQDISEADAADEGSFGWAGEQDTPVRDLTEARLVYRQLWEQINGAGAWDANPWVWVVEFKRSTQ